MRDKSSEKTSKITEEVSSLMSERAYGSSLNGFRDEATGGSNEEPDPYIMEFSILV